MADVSDAPVRVTPASEGKDDEGILRETRFGLEYEVPGLKTTFEITDTRRRSGELSGELTVRCALDGVRTQLDESRLRQGSYNFSSIRTRAEWAKAVAKLCPAPLNNADEWENLFERMCQEVLEHDKTGALHGGVLTGVRSVEGRPWAAYPILPHEETAMIYARGGAGKTSLVASLNVSLGLGRSLIPGIRVDRPYRVLVLDWETSSETANELLASVAEANHIEIPPTIWYEPMARPFERSLRMVASAIERHRANLVVVDSVGMAMLSGGDYTDAADSTIRLHQGLRALRAWGLLIDHVASEGVRGDKASIKPYGSVYKTNVVRHSINLHVTKRVGDTSRAFLICHKSNVLRDRWAMDGVYERTDTTMRWEFGSPSFDLYEDLMSGRILPDEGPGEGALADAIVDLLSRFDEGLRAPEIAERLRVTDIGKVRHALVLAGDRVVLSGSRWSLA